MGLIDQMRDSVVSVSRVALQAAGDGADQFNSWAEGRGQEAANREFDQFIEKASTAAIRAGNTGHKERERNLAGNRPKEGEGDQSPGERKALHFDPFDLVAAMGYRERPSPLTYSAMERVGRSVPVIADIITTRTNQVLMFCDKPEGRHAAGFEIRLSDRSAKASKATDKRIAELTDIMLHCGYYDEAEESTSLTDFAKMFVPDSLMYDQGCFEVVPDSKGRPSYFAIVDPSTIRLLDPGYRDAGDPFCVQVIGGSIVESFTSQELAFCVRNPRSGIKAYGYGTSEIESLVREITGFLWGMDYNRRFFTQGSATRGILNFKGTIPDKQLRAFRRQWYSMVSGVSNAWRTPITNADELQWINMQMSNRDMEYSAWLDFLIKVCCARYNIAPEEVNFSYGNTGQTNSMGGQPLEEKIKASKDLGLRPLVRWFFTQLNIHFLQKIDPDYEMVPVGLDDKGEENEIDLLAKEGGAWLTIDECRERRGEEPLGPDKGGDVIENQVWMQWFNAMKQEEQMAAGEEGEEFDEGDEYGDEEPNADEFDFDHEIDFDSDEDESASAPEETTIKGQRDLRALRARLTFDL